MLLTSVILILQETLEAALLVAILAAVTLQTGQRLAWLPWGLVAGCVLGTVYAVNLQRVSEWFDFVGQELANSALQLSIAVAIVVLAFLIVRKHVRAKAAERTSIEDFAFSLTCALTVMLAITREGSEIMIYLGGILGQDDHVQAVLAGSAIGFGIGISVGLLVFYGLLGLSGTLGRWFPVALLALFSGNMLAQSAQQLIQADWLQAGPTVWDTSAWLTEQSITGHLLYALLGYEATPSLLQVIAYLAGVITVMVAALASNRNAARTRRVVQ